MKCKSEPEYLTKARAAYNSLHQQYQFLQTINPAPYFDIEDVGYAMDRAFGKLQQAIKAYESTPSTCRRCNLELAVMGDDVYCPQCGVVYYPAFEFDPIPF